MTTGVRMRDGSTEDDAGEREGAPSTLLVAAAPHTLVEDDAPARDRMHVRDFARDLVLTESLATSCVEALLVDQPHARLDDDGDLDRIALRGRT